MQGEADVQVGVADAQALADSRPDAELVLLPDVNHVLKQVTSDAEQTRSYTDPSFPLGAGLVDAIASFLAP